MHIFTSTNKNIYFISVLVFVLSLLVHSAAQSESETIKRVNILWSDKKNCFEEGAFMIAIETYGDTYKVAACVKYGCRIAVQEFGKKTHQGNYRYDPKFTWLSDTVFETKINGNNMRFYHCLTK